MAGNDGLLGTPLQGGFLPPVNPGSSQEVQIKALNDVINRLNQLLKTQVFSDGTNKRMIIGYQENGWGTGKHFGIKISEAGVDVTSADDTQLTFKMDMETWSFYRATDSTNFLQIGLLPDGSYGWVTAVAGSNVSEIF